MNDGQKSMLELQLKKGSRVVECKCSDCKSNLNGYCLADSITISETCICKHFRPKQL